MSRSLKKGPFVDEKLYKKVVAMNESNEKICDQDLVTFFHHLP